MKKILSFALIFALLVSVLLVFPAHAAASSGYFGNDMFWNFDDESGVLEISGNGSVNELDQLSWYPNINTNNVKKITLVSGVTGLSYGVLADYPELTELSIPETTVSIAEGAISHIPALLTVTVDENNPAYKSEGNCLIEKATGKLILGANTSVIPEGVASIADGAFLGYEGFENLHIPASVVEIAPNAFRNCGIAQITVADGNPVYRADGNCLIERATGKIVLGCRNSVIPDDGSIAEIGEAAFMDCMIETVYIPDSVVTIGEGAFANCFALTEARLPEGLEAIPAGMFSCCESLEEIDIPDSVTSIGDGALFGCLSLTEIYIPDEVEVIGAGAFAGCENATSIRLPEGLTEIGDGTFESCLSLAQIDLPDSLEVIGECAFVDCMSLESVDIPDGVTDIGDSAFAFCTSLTDLELPDSLESIGYGAFANCEALENITLPESLMTIEDDAFIDSSIIFTEYEGALYLGTEDNPYYALVETAEDIAGEVHINPDTKIICNAAFEGQNQITEVDIPDGVKSIGSGAFERCPSIERVRIPTGLSFLGSGAFAGCFGIRNISIPIRILAQDPTIFGDSMHVEEFFLSGTPAEMEEYGDEIDLSAYPGVDVHMPGDPIALPGDVDGDGAVTVRDYSIIKKFIAGAVTLEGQLLENADVNGDGLYTMDDVKAIKQILSN